MKIKENNFNVFKGIILKLKKIITIKLNEVPNNRVVEPFIKHRIINIKAINLFKKDVFFLNLYIADRL